MCTQKYQFQLIFALLNFLAFVRFLDQIHLIYRQLTSNTHWRCERELAQYHFDPRRFGYKILFNGTLFCWWLQFVCGNVQIRWFNLFAIRFFRLQWLRCWTAPVNFPLRHSSLNHLFICSALKLLLVTSSQNNRKTDMDPLQTFPLILSNCCLGNIVHVYCKCTRDFFSFSAGSSTNTVFIQSNLTMLTSLLTIGNEFLFHPRNNLNKPIERPYLVSSLVFTHMFLIERTPRCSGTISVRWHL